MSNLLLGFVHRSIWLRHKRQYLMMIIKSHFLLDFWLRPSSDAHEYNFRVDRMKKKGKKNANPNNMHETKCLHECTYSHDSMSKNHLGKLADVVIYCFHFAYFHTDYVRKGSVVNCIYHLTHSSQQNRVIALVLPTFLKTRPVRAASHRTIKASFCRLCTSQPTTRRWACAWRRTAMPIQLHLYMIQHRRLRHRLLPSNSNWD
jgi:hypothetical protein